MPHRAEEIKSQQKHERRKQEARIASLRALDKSWGLGGYYNLKNKNRHEFVEGMLTLHDKAVHGLPAYPRQPRQQRDETDGHMSPSRLHPAGCTSTTA